MSTSSPSSLSADGLYSSLSRHLLPFPDLHCSTAAALSRRRPSPFFPPFWVELETERRRPSPFLPPSWVELEADRRRPSPSSGSALSICGSNSLSRHLPPLV